jgi:hypothetical protein
MDWAVALETLEFNAEDTIDRDTLKKHYHKLALKHHPDKNQNSDVSKTKFQKIQDAYQYLNSVIDPGSSNCNMPNDPSYNSSSTQFAFDYTETLHKFMETFLSQNNKSFFDIVKQLVMSGCKTISAPLFEKLDREDAMELFSFLCKYHTILHIGSDILKQVKEIVAKKFENVQVFLLNPSLRDLLVDNIYKLSVDGNVYFVPLWHSEVYFDGKTDEIIVKCIPDLPENMHIDDNNALHVNITRPFHNDYLDTHNVKFDLEGKEFEISRLMLKRTHTYFLPDQGVPYVTDIDDIQLTETSVTKRAGVYVTLTFT